MEPHRTSAHPTAMGERPGPVVRLLFRRFFEEIVFSEANVERIRAAERCGTVIYVCKTLSVLDYLYFSFALFRHGLPLARFANGIAKDLWQPVVELWRALVLGRARPDDEPLLGQVVDEGGAALLFLKRPQTLFGRAPRHFEGRYMEALIAAQARRGLHGRPVVFVPLALAWGSPAVRAARSRRGVVDRLFGEREAPGRLRSWFTFFKDYKDSQVLVGEPLELPTFLMAEEGAPSEVLVRRLRWQLAGRIEAELRVLLGPPRKGARRLRDEVLRSRQVVATAQALAEGSAAKLRELLGRARALLREIAAEPKPWLFAVGRPLLDWIFGRIFDGIEVDQAGLERVRAAARKGPLVIVPSHKSHIDYLVLSYVFAENDLVPPHIAAGSNLGFWPIGFFFRRGGAFFVRRTFRGDRLYGEVLSAYVRKLLREGHNIEFFIEGGRSRTGKLLAPKFGLLGMIVDAALEREGGRARQAQLVPVSIGYEKVIEGESYTRELLGGEKQKESVKGLLRATRVLGSQYGRLNIQFAEPLPLGRTLVEDGALLSWRPDSDTLRVAGPEERRQATQRLGYRIVHAIDRITAVTPTALAAATLLSSRRSAAGGAVAMVRREFLAVARFLVARVLAGGGRLAVPMGSPHDAATFDREPLDRALFLLMRDGDLELVKSGGAGEPLPDDLYLLPDERRPQLAYYRNNAIHALVAEALVALAFVGAATATLPLDRLRERTLSLSRLLKLEFVYRPGESFEAIFERTFGQLLEAGLFAWAGERVTSGQLGRLETLAAQVADFVEAYAIAASGLGAARAPLSERELVRRIAELGEQRLLTGGVRRREACVQASFANAVRYFSEQRVLLEEGQKLRLASDARPEALAAEIEALLPPARPR